MTETGVLTGLERSTASLAARSSDSLALVLPTLRESATIESIIRQIVPVLDKLQIAYELIVVDDGSDDGTCDIVRRLFSIFPRLRLVERVGERGLSGAILDGWATSSSSIVGVIDADLQHPPALLPRLWEATQNGAEVAVASRYAQGATTGRWRWLRRMASSFAMMLCRPLQGSCRVQDPMSGFFMMRRSVLAGLPPLQRSGFKLLLEVLVRAPLHKVHEVPFCFGVRQGGRSKAGFSVIRDYVFLLLRLFSTPRLTRDGIGFIPLYQSRS